jgi:hypothetical protein
MSAEKKRSLLSPWGNQTDSGDDSESSIDPRSGKKRRLEDTYKTPENDKIAQSYLKSLDSAHSPKKSRSSEKGSDAPGAGKAGKKKTQPDDKTAAKRTGGSPPAQEVRANQATVGGSSRASVMQGLLHNPTGSTTSGSHGMTAQDELDRRLRAATSTLGGTGSNFMMPPFPTRLIPVDNLWRLKNDQALAGNLAQLHSLDGGYQWIDSLYRHPVLQAQAATPAQPNLTDFLGGQRGYPPDPVTSTRTDILNYQRRVDSLRSTANPAFNPSIYSQSQSRNLGLPLSIPPNASTAVPPGLEQTMTSASSVNPNPNLRLLNLLESTAAIGGAANPP